MKALLLINLISSLFCLNVILFIHLHLIWLIKSSLLVKLIANKISLALNQDAI